MNKNVEKRENNNKYCNICLSSDRKLRPIGYLASIFRKFSSKHHQNNSCSGLEICWECKATLMRFDQLKNKVERSKYMFINFIKTNDIPESLSSLTTTLITEDTHKLIYFTEQAESQELKNEIYDDIDFDEHDYKEEDNTLIDKTIEKTQLSIINIKNEKLQTKKLINNTWARKRAKLNKKIKFKKVPLQKSDIKNMYKGSLVNPNELNKIFEKERDNDIFMAKLFKCNKCILGFDTKKSYTKHNLVFHNKLNKKYICNTCQTQLPTKKQLVLHCREHLYEYTCTVCGYTCCKKCHICEHVKVCHQYMYQCVTCQLQFGSHTEFTNHFKANHENFICDYCGVKFKMKYCIRNHIRKKHYPLSCTFCPRTFFRYNTLWLHKKLKHPAQEPERAYCVECNKHYHNIYSYKWHLNNSVRHRPRKKISVPCPGCDKVFSKNIYMKDHYDLVHLNHYKYRCEQCNKNFVRNADLVKHTRRVHDGVQKPKNKICYVCGRGFSSNKILTNHIRTHTGEKPFHCEFCSAKFAQKIAMIVHVKNVHLKKKTAGYVQASNDNKVWPE